LSFSFLCFLEHKDLLAEMLIATHEKVKE
jgi:hypothetical protein